MATEATPDYSKLGQDSYQRWRDELPTISWRVAPGLP